MSVCIYTYTYTYVHVYIRPRPEISTARTPEATQTCPKLSTCHWARYNLNSIAEMLSAGTKF